MAPRPSHRVHPDHHRCSKEQNTRRSEQTGNVRAVALLICLLLVGCGTSSMPGPPAPETPTTTLDGPSSSQPSALATTTTPSPSGTAVSPTRSPSQQPDERRGTTIITGDSQFGSMLYDASGQAIYLFDAERGSRPKCYGECADDWPPVLTTGKPGAKGGVQPDLLATTRRTDGTTQVTYAGHPLYFYAHEGKYQVLCHDIVEYGGTWLVVQPDGEPAPH